MLSESGSSRSYYDAQTLSTQLVPVVQPPATKGDRRSTIPSGLGPLREMWLTLVFVALTAWAAWVGFSWLLARWQMV